MSVKKSIFFISLFLFTRLSLTAQNTVTGKWKAKKIYSEEMGMMPAERDSLVHYATGLWYLEHPGKTMSSQDSAELCQFADEMAKQFSYMTVEYRANKTYTANGEEGPVSGTYVYNAAKKTLTIKAKGKPAKLISVSFVDGLLKLQTAGNPMAVYMEREKKPVVLKK